ncbi:MAG: hypothetical protein RL272_130, partial [Candidatus Parcubacteria bacterium]
MTLPMADADKSFFSTYRLALLFFALFELVSFWAFIVPPFSSIAWIVIVAVTAALAVKRFDLAMLILLAELFIGSQGGYMVTLGAEQGLFLSLRHGLFLIVVGIWFAELIAATLAGGERRRDAWGWFRAMAARGLLVPYALMLAV